MAGLEAPPESTASAQEPPLATAPPGEPLGRATATITAWNLVSRVTGFARVIATGAALGFAGLGDAFQSANVVSNILFELLAGGLLFSVLVPTFVAAVDQGHRHHAARLASALLGRALVGLGAIALVGAVVGPWIMRGLTVGSDQPELREAQVELGAFLLWFFMPQLLLYAAGAIATALLQAERRFTAAAVAPVCNNLVAIATMVAFAAVHDGGGLDLTTAEKVLLGGGTLAGTVAMTAVPLLAVRRRGLSLRPRWTEPGAALGRLARKGLWGAGHVGLNQVLVGATIVFAGQVVGGVLAYQIAFTFFLLPHAVLAHPIFTTLFPRLSAHAAVGRNVDFADDVSLGMRSMALLLAPAAALLAVTALPVLTLVQIGQLDADGAELVAGVLAAYAVGLPGYSAFFLLTRASYALDDVRSPTVVNLGVTVVAIAGMGLSSVLVDGDARVVVLGLVHAVAVTAGAAVLYTRVRAMAGQPITIGATLARAAVGTAVAVLAAAAVVDAVGSADRSRALISVVTAGTVGVAGYVLALWALRTPELIPVQRELRRRRRKDLRPSP